jgi:ParB-like nuclease family protein
VSQEQELNHPGGTIWVSDHEGRYGNRGHITREVRGLVPVADLLQLPGASGEEKAFIYDRISGTYFRDPSARLDTRYDQAKWERLVESIRQGYDLDNPIFVVKDPGYLGMIREGNHRLRAAHEAGFDYIPATIRYFGHSERDGLITTVEPPAPPPWEEEEEENPAADYLAELADMGDGELEDYFPQTAAGEMETFDRNLYYGRNVIWDGYDGRMVRVSAEHLDPIEGNIFDEDKLAAVRDGILQAEERLVFTAPYGEAHLIQVDDIKESIEYGDDDVLTTDDEELDRWLVDWEEYLYEEGFDPDDDPEAWAEAQAEMQAQLEQAVRDGWGDLGAFRFQIRDGNHRAFGALAAGEPYIWMIISDNQMQDANDPSVQHPSVVALREIVQ